MTIFSSENIINEMLLKAGDADMHELGVLYHVVKTVNAAAAQNNIERIKYISLEVGLDSGFVPHYLGKLFPVAADSVRLLEEAVLRISRVPGSGLVIKEIGY